MSLTRYHRKWPKVGEVWETKAGNTPARVKDSGDRLKVQRARRVVLTPLDRSKADIDISLSSLLSVWRYKGP